MKLTLKRTTLQDHYTIGKLYVNGQYFCDTLEDTVRDLGVNGEGKIFGETAIPYGDYKIDLTFSNRFNRILPLLLEVPFFTGIRIHPGNKAVDTHGCLLVGKNTIKGQITNSRETFDELFDLMQRETDLQIEII
jgi:hypothetical protein